MKKLFNRVFKLEEINGGNRCPTYLFRWTLVRLFGWNVYLHYFVEDDWSRDLHDHPKRFFSIGLWGSYVEETPSGETRYRAPWIRSFPAEHRHRLRLDHGRTCMTLVIVGKPSREWGFWPGGIFVPFRKYISSRAADDAKACE